MGMSDVAHAARRGFFAIAHNRRSDPRPPLVALVWALCAVTVLFFGQFAIGTYDSLVGSVDDETDPGPVAVAVGPVSMAVPRNMIREYPLAHGNVSQLDLRLHWPTMEGFSELRSDAFRTNDERSTILYATLRPSNGVLSPQERQRLVYTRLLEQQALAGPAGLIATPFGIGHGYDGEILYMSPDGAAPFVARCAQEGAAGQATGVPPTCIVEFRTADGIDVLYRFRRHLLSRWRAIDAAMRKTVTSFMLDR